MVKRSDKTKQPSDKARNGRNAFQNGSQNGMREGLKRDEREVQSILDHISGVLDKAKGGFIIPSELDVVNSNVYYIMESGSITRSRIFESEYCLVVNLDKSGQGYINKVFGREVGDATIKLYLDIARRAIVKTKKKLECDTAYMIRVATGSDETKLIFFGENPKEFEKELRAQFKEAITYMMKPRRLRKYKVEIGKNGGTIKRTLADYAKKGVLWHREVLGAFKPEFSKPLLITPETEHGFISRLILEADLRCKDYAVGVREMLGIGTDNTDPEILQHPDIRTVSDDERVSGKAVEINFTLSPEVLDVLREPVCSKVRKGLFEVLMNLHRFRALNILGYDVTDTAVSAVERIGGDLARKRELSIGRCGDLLYILENASEEDLSLWKNEIERELGERGITLGTHFRYFDVSDASVDDVFAHATWSSLGIDGMTAEDLMYADQLVIAINYMFDPQVINHVLGNGHELNEFMDVLRTKRAIRNTKDLVVFFNQREKRPDLLKAFFSAVKNKDTRERLDRIHDVILELPKNGKWWKKLFNRFTKSN